MGASRRVRRCPDRSPPCSFALLAHPAAAQPLFTDALPKEEFAARRARVMAQIGDGVAIIQGAAESPAYVKFRQANQFFYLCGVEVPRAILVIDGRDKRIAALRGAAQRAAGALRGTGARARRRGRARSPASTPVLARDQFAATVVALGQQGRTVYTPFRPETQGAGTPGNVLAGRRRRRPIRGTGVRRARRRSSRS